MTVQSARVVLERAASVANIAMLRANDLPNQMQIMAINELTAILESELDLLPPDDTSTSETREKIVDQLAIHRAILAPVRRLPKELLMEIIFVLVNESPLRSLRVAATIAHVCSVWRAVAHGITNLWTKAVVKSVRDFDMYCELFLPLTKRLPDLRCDDREILSRLWDRIEPYASSWRSITLEGQLRTFPDLKVLHMENLERLIVDAYDPPLSLDLSALDFVVAPRLRHISLTLDALESARQLHVPVARALTSLLIDTMTPFPVTHTLPLLHACAGTLDSLTLKVRYPLEGPEGSYPTSAPDTFVMKSLTALSLVDPACALLNHINAPRIEELILSNVPAYGSCTLLGFLTRSQASRSLDVLRVYIPDERDVSAWIPCLRLMDSLRDLHFDVLLSNADFLTQMIRRPDTPTLLPSLQGINIVKIYREHEELRRLIGKMCGSRAKRIDFKGMPAWHIISWIID